MLASGIIAHTQGRDPLVAAGAAQNEALNNYLSWKDQRDRKTSLLACQGNAACKQGVDSYYDALDKTQTGLKALPALASDARETAQAGAGLTQGLAQSGINSVVGLAELVANPGQAVEGLKGLLQSESVLSTLTDAARSHITESLTQADGLIGQGSIQEGFAIYGKLLGDVAQAAAGGYGLASGGAALVSKIAQAARGVEAGAAVGGAKGVGGLADTIPVVPGKVIGQFDMVTSPGPLAKMPGTPAANFSGGKYTAITLTEDATFYRGGSSTSSPLGQWFTSEPPTSIAQVRIDTAVKPQWIDPMTGQLTGTSPVDVVYAIKIPSGTTIYQGPVASQGGIYVGGSGAAQTQIFIPKTTPGLTPVGVTPLH